MVVALPVCLGVKFRFSYDVNNQNDANYYLVQHFVDMFGVNSDSQAFSLISATLKVTARAS